MSEFVLKLITMILCFTASAFFSVRMGIESADKEKPKRADACFFWLLYGIFVGVLIGIQINF